MKIINEKMKDPENKEKEDEAEYHIHMQNLVHEVLRKGIMLAVPQLKGNTHDFHCLYTLVAFCLRLSKSRGPLCLWNDPRAEDGPLPAHLHLPYVPILSPGEEETVFFILCDCSLSQSSTLHPGTYVACISLPISSCLFRKERKGDTPHSGI